MKKTFVFVITLVFLAGFVVLGYHSSALAQEPDDIVDLGRAIFFDEALSANGTQSCATCHAPEVGFSGPDSQVNLGGAVYQGAFPNRFGNRKPPTSAYAGDSPELYQDDSGAWFGGMFWDGRATGSCTIHWPNRRKVRF